MTSAVLSDEERQRINAGITDRSHVFYWQSDRLLTPKEAGIIWSDRHHYFTDTEIIQKINQIWKDDQIVSLTGFDTDASISLGNVNSVRIGHTKQGKDVIIRLHPKGIQNGYFYVEACASHEIKLCGLPGYTTYCIHDVTHMNDVAFHICEKLPGVAVQKWIESHKDSENAFVYLMGATLASMHRIPVVGFGPFDNTLAKKGELQGIHATEKEAVLSSLMENLQVLVQQHVFTKSQIDRIFTLFMTTPLLTCTKPLLLHNDFADWNIMTDGKKITGIIDWDECIGGDPISDIACWSTFFEPKRLEIFMNGYFSKREKPVDFDRKFELLRFRYIISKMTLRLRKNTWAPSPFLQERIEAGKHHLALSLNYFNIS